MMKKLMIAVVGIGFIALSQMALGSDEESFQQRCEKEAIEENIDAAGYDDYISDCISYYQGSDRQLEEDSSDLEEESEEEVSMKD